MRLRRFPSLPPIMHAPLRRRHYLRHCPATRVT
jgi:hypothetical protein